MKLMWPVSQQKRFNVALTGLNGYHTITVCIDGGIRIKRSCMTEMIVSMNVNSKYHVTLLVTFESKVRS